MDMFGSGKADGYAVKIAILDSGIDAMHPDVRPFLNSVDYHDFIDGDHEHKVDDSGHGTHVAAVVLGLAKSARVFAARIVKGHNVITPSVVAEVCSLFYPNKIVHL